MSTTESATVRGPIFHENYLEIRVKNFKAVLMFKHLRNNTFSLNDTLCLELKGTAKLLGVVFHTSFLSRFKAIIPLRTTGCRSYCLNLLNKKQFSYFEPLYQGNCCKSMAYWRQRLEIAKTHCSKLFCLRLNFAREGHYLPREVFTNEHFYRSLKKKKNT